jgi:hypothetical protein
MESAAAKLFGTLQPNNIGVAVDKSANFFQRLFPSRITQLIAEGNQSHDKDRTDAIGRRVSARRRRTISSCENGCASSFGQLVVSPVAKTSPNLLALIEMSFPLKLKKHQGAHADVGYLSATFDDCCVAIFTF